MPIEITNDVFGYQAKDNGKKILTVFFCDVTFPYRKYQERTVCEIRDVVLYQANISQKTEAMHLIYKKIEEDYGEPPYIPAELDYDAKKILSILFSQGLIPKIQLLEPEFEQYKHDLSSSKAGKAAKANIVATTTKLYVSSTPRYGALPKKSSVIERAPRSYNKDRTQQLLRHVATQLFHFCKVNHYEPVEVQLLYLEGSLVIATNSIEATNFLSAQLTPELLKHILCTTYLVPDEQESKALSRFARKLKARVYGKHTFAHKREQIIQKLLREFKKSVIDTRNLAKINFEPGQIYLVTNINNGVQHAEMHLLQVLKFFEDQSGHAYGSPVIYGKKRPCFTCHISLTQAEQEGLEFSFNNYPGLFFFGELKRQTETSAQETVHTLTYYRDVYTSSSVPTNGYCTLSDSEDDGTPHAAHKI